MTEDNNNSDDQSTRLIIVAVVVSVSSLVCCGSLAVAWMVGDEIIDILNDFSTVIQVLPA